MARSVWSCPPVRPELKVQAPNYRPAVAVFVIEVNKVKEKNFVLEPMAAPTGSVALICDAGNGECEVGLDDRNFESTNKKSLQLSGLALGPHRIVVRSNGFLDSSRTLTVKGGADEAVNVETGPNPRR